MTLWKRIFLHGLGLTAATSFVLGTAWAQTVGKPLQPVIPKTWDEKALADWATPLAVLNVRPDHFSEEEYYRAPLDNYRTYPVYAPGREPAGYWEMIQKVGPKPLIEPGRLKTRADWVEAGRRVFEEFDHITLRNYDPAAIIAARSFEATGPDGVVGSVRWVPTEKGLALGLTNCESCHARRELDGRRIAGPPVGSAGHGAGGNSGALPFLGAADHVAGAPIRLAGSARPPFVPRLRCSVACGRYSRTCRKHGSGGDPTTEGPAVAVSNGVFARWNGSFFYPSKIPDLIGVKDRKYLDATGTHLNRGSAI